MKRFVLTTFLLALGTAGLTFADPVFYDTAQSYFSCTANLGLSGCGTNQVVLGNIGGQNPDGVVLTYVPTKVDNLNATPSSITNFGRILVSCYGGGTACSAESAPLDLTFSIVIHQTGPEGFTGAIAAAAITGTFAGQSGFGFATWNQGASISSNGANFNVSYSILLNNNRLGLVVPASDNCSGTVANPCPVAGPAGETSIQGSVSATSVPEPAVSLLFAGGLVAIGMIRRRK